MGHDNGNRKGEAKKAGAGGGKAVASPSTQQQQQQPPAAAKVKERKHPCLVQYGECQYGRYCRFAEMPGDTCLEFLRGRCTRRSDCWHRHDVAAGACVDRGSNIIPGVGEVRKLARGLQEIVPITPEQSQRELERRAQKPLIDDHLHAAPRKPITLAIDPSASSRGDVAFWADAAEAPEPPAPKPAAVPSASSIHEFPTLGTKRPPANSNGKPKAAASGARQRAIGTRLVVSTREPAPGDPSAACEPDDGRDAKPWSPSPWAAAVKKGTEKLFCQEEAGGASNSFFSTPLPQPTLHGQAPAAAAAPVNLQAGAGKGGPNHRPDPKSRHPCVQQFGSCKFGRTCAYLELPGNTCLMFLQGQCKFGATCRNLHQR
ncbi:cycling sequence binding protein [Diplonema papillatum]|nr:cycling sequence binding protein [Diplonema papillatum]